VDAVAARIHRELADIFGRRRVVGAGGVLAGMGPLVAELRAVGAERVLLLPTSVGTGPPPQGDDVEVLLHELPATPTATEQFRAEERLFADPPAALLDAIREFTGDAEALVVAQPFSAVRAFGPFPVFGPRRAEWVALEDKTVGDALFDTAGVPHPPSLVVRVDGRALDDACTRLDDGAGTVWAGDARDGFNGGAEYVRWVRDESSRRAALDFFGPRCDHVRVAPFVEGVPCSIHGFVTAAGVAVLRPVELITLRVDDDRGLRYAGAATYFDPAPIEREAMRAAARRLGACLAARVDFRGGFTIDGICGAGGWTATECNPRGGAGLGYLGACAPDLLGGLTQRAAAAGALTTLDHDALERSVLARADARRWGGAWTPTEAPWSATSTTPVVGDQRGYRRTEDGEIADATIMTGPGPAGGFVRFEPVPERTPAGPSLAPRAVAALAFADAELGAGIGALAPARTVDARQSS
jgi:hypothetical protein